jgi:hypothetical protein
MNLVGCTILIYYDVRLTKHGLFHLTQPLELILYIPNNRRGVHRTVTSWICLFCHQNFFL